MTSRKKTRPPKTGKTTSDVVDDIVERVEDLVNEELGDDASFEEYERAVLRITNEIARRRLQRKLQGLADGYAPQLRIDHNNDWHGWREGTAHEFRAHLPGVVRYHSLVGPLEVRRFTYRECHRNGVTYVPLELDAGLMERMTPGLAKAVAFGISQMPVREVEAMLLASNRCPPSRSTLDRSGRDLGAYALACNEEVEPKVRADETVPPQARAIVLGLDRTSRQYRIPSDAEPEAIVERMMDDSSAIGRGLPIGSGVTEGARAKRGGRRWTQRGWSATLDRHVVRGVRAGASAGPSVA
jgi:hypothetical protein